MGRRDAPIGPYVVETLKVSYQEDNISEAFEKCAELEVNNEMPTKPKVRSLRKENLDFKNKRLLLN